MATELQKRANRANALKSTGPKTDEGRAAVRLNATRHGLLARAPVVAGEDEGEYLTFLEQLKNELAPVGILETQLAERMASALWRLRRLSHIEAGILTGNAAQTFAEAADAQAANFTRTEGGNDAVLMAIIEESQGKTVVTDEVAHADATDAAREARAVLWSIPALLGAAYQRDAEGADALAKLSRYETTLERNLCRLGEQLAQLQKRRIEAQKAN